MSNSQRTPPPPTSAAKSYDPFHTNVSPNHSPISYSYIAQTFTPSASTTTNSPSLKPRSLQLTAPTLNQVTCNQFIHHIPSSNNVLKYITNPQSQIQPQPQSQIQSQPPLQSQSQSQSQSLTQSQSQPFNIQQITTIPTSSQNNSTNIFNTKVLPPLQDIISCEPLPSSSSQQPQQSQQHQLHQQHQQHQHQQHQQSSSSEILQTNIYNDITQTLPTDDVSYYLFGDDPLSNSTNVTKPPLNSLCDKQNEEILQLREQLLELKEQLRLEKEKNLLLLQSCLYDDNNSKNEAEKIQQIQQIQWFEKYMTCLNCHCQKKTSRDNVLIPCGHLVCGECVPQKGQYCPICKTIVNQNVQKLNL